LVVPILTRVGDLVCSTPVFREIKRVYPRVHLAVVVGRKAKGILVHNERIDELIDYNKECFHGWLGRARFFCFLFSQNFDAVYALGTSVIGTLCGIFSAAPWRVKTTVSQPPLFEILTDWLNTHKVLYRTGSFLPAHYLSLLFSFGVRVGEPVKEVFTTVVGDKKVREWLSRAGFTVGVPVVGMTVSAGNKIKEWPCERFAAVADMLVERFGARILFIDSPPNRARAEETYTHMRHQESAAIATEFSLEELPSLIKELSLFIAADTGAIYIAHALGIPLVDIIGPVHPDEQPPRDERSIQVLPKEGIKPTSFVLAVQKHNVDHTCAVLSIEVTDVFAACVELHARGFFHPPLQV
jgi:ADP-heptose:LPS heptosyltransferase